jgi:methyltransferase
MQLSRYNERALRARGAVEPPDDVYRTMAWVYPGLFVVMALEGAFFGPPAGLVTLAGLILLGASKALKFWAIASLGTRWTFRVLVPPGASLVSSGPYAYVRHPNYVAVMGELASMALLVGARVSGPVAMLIFGVLMRHRIRVEEAALRHPPCS